MGLLLGKKSTDHVVSAFGLIFDDFDVRSECFGYIRYLSDACIVPSALYGC